MIKSVSRMIVAAAAGSLVFAPIAAQAGTRASDSAAFYSSAASLAADDDDAGGDDGGLFSNPGAIFLNLIAGGLIITGIVFAAQTDNDGQSPGT